MMKYIVSIMAFLIIGLGGYAFIQKQSIEDLEMKNANLERSVATFQKQAEQSKLAREVEAARAKGFAERNKQLSSTIEEFLTGNIPDAQLDPNLADYLNGLR